MSAPKPGPEQDRTREIIAQARRDREQQERSYRGRALKLFPPVCAHCGREFSGYRLRELTVHHKDGDHTNNPPDGSNWELLCLYCHDYEHSLLPGQSAPEAQQAGRESKAHLTFRPFANLRAMLEEKSKEQQE